MPRIQVQKKAPVICRRSPSAIAAAFEPAAITGKDLTSAQFQFQSYTGLVQEPVVVLKFNAESSRIFAELTKENVEKFR